MPKKSIGLMLRDESAPLELRLKMLKQICASGDEGFDELLSKLLAAASRGSADEVLTEKTRALAELIEQLESGPLRCATFDRSVESERFGRRAQVILADGTPTFCAVPDEKLWDALRCGDTVWLDAQCRALLFHLPGTPALGEEAQLERELPSGDVEESVGELGRVVCRASARLRDQLARGEARPGSTLVVCQRRMVAFEALPPARGAGHRRHLSGRPVPDVQVERDVGAPPDFIEDLARHVHRELLDPELGRRYRLRRSRLLLATGIPGSGKTHAILALWRRLYELLAELTGAGLEDLPPRVLELRASEVLSKWVGGSDRRIGAFFDEVEEVAGETYTAPDGRRWELPVLVILEEIDALARKRGEDPIHDRIQTTLLTRLDPSLPLFRDRLVLVVCTSNVPGLLDTAFVRRVGGRIEVFGRLDRAGFRAVLGKQLGRRPCAEPAPRVVADVASWLFAPNGGDPGQVELTFVGASTPVVKRRRDFLTAALIDRAVQQASAEACDAAWHGAEDPGLTTLGLVRALDAQVRAVADQLEPGNCAQHLTLPDGARVGTVRRLEQPALLPIELERAG